MRTIYNKILIAMDDSEDSSRVAKKVIDLVKNGDCNDEEQAINQKYPEIVAFHSIDHHHRFSAPGRYRVNNQIPAVDSRKLQEEYRTYGKKILNNTEKLFEKENIDIETRLIEEDKPEEYIEKMIEKEDFDLIALGSKGEHSKLEQIFSRSIAQKVLNDVQCDILVVK